ncbi:MAG: hypothetical protein JXR03_10665 [Cyclobacteriaceae bacterium]
MIRTALLFLFCGIPAFLLHAQSYEDSKGFALSRTEDESVKKEILFLLGEYLVQRNPEKAEEYANQLLGIATSSDSNEWTRINYIHGTHSSKAISGQQSGRS